MQETKMRRIPLSGTLRYKRIAKSEPGDQTLCLLTIKKKDLSFSGFCCFSGPQSENKRKRKDRQIPEQRTEMGAETEGDSGISSSLNPWNGLQKFRKETGGTGDQRKNWDHADHSALKIG